MLFSHLKKRIADINSMLPVSSTPLQKPHPDPSTYRSTKPYPPQDKSTQPQPHRLIPFRPYSHYQSSNKGHQYSNPLTGEGYSSKQQGIKTFKQHRKFKENFCTECEDTSCDSYLMQVKKRESRFEPGGVKLVIENLHGRKQFHGQCQPREQKRGKKVFSEKRCATRTQRGRPYNGYKNHESFQFELA